MSQIQYDILSVKNAHMVKSSVKGNLNVLSAHRKTTRAAIVITIQSAPIVANLTWLHRKIVIISCKKKRSKKLNQKQISFPEACKNHVSVAKRIFNSVEAMFTWIEDTEKPTRLTVNPKEKNCNTITLSIKFFSDSQPFSSNFNYFYKFNKIIFYMFFLMYKYGCLYVY